MNRRLRLLLVLGILLAPAASAESDPKAGLPDAPGPVRLAFVGDIMLADGPGRTIRRGGDPLAAVAPWLDAADLRIGNLECVVADNGRAMPGKPWTFRAHPRTVAILKRHIDIVSLANNHSGDYGPAAFVQMLDRLTRARIAYFGGGRDLRAAHQPLIVTRRGLRIAFLGYNEFLPRSFEAGDDRPGVAWSEDEQVRYDIQRARHEFQADLVIPFMHWGWEFAPLAAPRQRQLARLMVDAGADAVIGSHPHVTQDTEAYRGKPIIYSLGNFVFDGFDDTDTTTGWLLDMTVDRSGVTGWRTHIARLDRQGTPHPQKGGGLCWTPGMNAGQPCPD